MTLQGFPSSIAVSVVFAMAAGVFDNHLWRIVLCWMLWRVTALFGLMTGWMGAFMYLLSLVIIWNMPMFVNLQYRKRQGSVIVVTGCDSGMGQATVCYLAQSKNKDDSYQQIFAGCLNTKASQDYFDKNLTPEQKKIVTVLPLDVTNQDSVDQATKTVDSYLSEHKDSPTLLGLTGICMYHGIAFNGPAPYMPVEMYERQLQVNFLGSVRVTQAFLPLLKKRKSGIPGRIIFTGTGGGPCTPCPPLLTAYMASKFATEAFCQSLRQELFMTNTHIEALVINPGFVKPTMLMEEGKKLTEKMWKACEAKDRLGNTQAKDEFGPMMDHFIHYSALQPGTHVSEICKAAEHALQAPVPRSSYKVGPDSKAAPIVGMLPTGLRELIARHGIYGVLSPAGTVKGYTV